MQYLIGERDYRVRGIGQDGMFSKEQISKDDIRLGLDVAARVARAHRLAILRAHS